MLYLRSLLNTLWGKNAQKSDAEAKGQPAEELPTDQSLEEPPEQAPEQVKKSKKSRKNTKKKRKKEAGTAESEALNLSKSLIPQAATGNVAQEDRSDWEPALSVLGDSDARGTWTPPALTAADFGSNASPISGRTEVVKNPIEGSAADGIGAGHMDEPESIMAGELSCLLLVALKSGCQCWQKPRLALVIMLLSRETTCNPSAWGHQFPGAC